MLNIRPMQIVTAGVGVILFDLVFCKLIAPKVFDFLDLQAAKPKKCCAQCASGHTCKNVTDQGQVIDMDTFSRYKMLNSGRPENAA